jgi:tRNA threonylcarbamoyladenosine biosynthesis protein TsaB
MQARIIHIMGVRIKQKYMTTLALELSTETGTLAVVASGKVLMEKEWSGEDRRRRSVFADLRSWAEEGLEWAGIDRMAVGVGPGAFSGLRLAVSLVRGLTLPDAKPVTAVSSARALAGAVLSETGASQVAVVGDARRNELWAGCFEVRDGVVEQAGDWIVAAAGHLPERMKATGTVWVTSDWTRIGEVLAANCPATVRLLREPRLPRAAQVAILAEELARRGRTGEPVVPLYIHPAVSIAPRYS